jgi:3D (Asp-Asp-Asp) domain-containing protein
MLKIAKLILSVVVIFAASCASNERKLANKPINNNSLVVRTTAYTHSESDHRKYGRLSAVGTQLKSGKLRSAAADWSEFPVGTIFKIKSYPNYTFIIDDYGSALVGTKTIDLYQTTRRGMNNWGVRQVEIEVIRWGCLTTSKAILQDRLKYSHIRRMNSRIEEKLLKS